jgi:ubiquinone/menaquinone biosynthesis C-methylase UbiE
MNDYKKTQEDVRGFWNKNPCDSSVSSESREERRYYEEIEQDRYSYQGHINQIMDWLNWHEKKVLEIGTGVGTDARNIVRRGGLYQGINVDKGSVEITRKAFKVFGVAGDVKQCSATELCFPDASFDIVYSFGVIHHIPDAKSAIAEIARVLKPGGELLIMIYNRSSINYKLEILVLRKLFVRLLRIPGLIRLLGIVGFPEEKLRRHMELFSSSKNMTDQEWLSRNTDGPDNPYSIVYDSEEINDLLRLFDIKRERVFFFDARHWGVLGKILPARFVEFLGARYGWHRVVHAVKPG